MSVQLLAIIIIATVVGIVLVYFISSLFGVYFGCRNTFNERNSDPDNPCYLRWEDYETELVRESYKCDYNGESIRGFIYSAKDATSFNGFIILSHGIAASHIQYLIDVYYLCKEGFRVLAYDQYGCGESDGKCIYSFATGIFVCRAVIDDVKKRRINSNEKLFLYGHSWGGYSVAGALQCNKDIAACVIRSTFCDPINEMLGLLKIHSPAFYYFTRPTLRLCFRLIYGKKHMVKVNECIEQNGTTKCLVVQSKDDPVIPPMASMAEFYTAHPYKNVEVYFSDQHVHNSLITDEANKTYDDACKAYDDLLKIEDEKERNDKIAQFVASLNRRKMYPYSETKNVIVNFLRQHISP